MGAALIGCGGEVSSTADDGNGDTSVTGSCTYGELGRVSGAPYGVASTGKTVYVVASPIINSMANGAEGDLYAVSSSGVVAVARGVSTSLVPVADRAAYFRLEATTDGLRATNLQTVDDHGAVEPIDAVSDDFVDMGPVAFDGKNKLDWYRWPTLPGQPRALPSIASASISGPSITITTGSIDPDVLGVGAFVTDGVHDYAEFDTAEDGTVLGVLPVNADPKVVLVPATANPLEALDVDDTILLYSANRGAQGSSGLWEVPTAGGQPHMATDDGPSEARPFLHDHTIYWADHSEAPTTTIWKLSEVENSVAKVVVTTPRLVLAMAHDACGIVYTTLDDTEESGIVSRVAD